MNFFLGFLWSLFLLLFLLTLLLVAWCCHLFNAFIFFKAFAISNASYNIYSFAPSCFFFFEDKEKGPTPLSLPTTFIVTFINSCHQNCSKGVHPTFFCFVWGTIDKVECKVPPLVVIITTWSQYKWGCFPFCVFLALKERGAQSMLLCTMCLYKATTY